MSGERERESASLPEETRFLLIVVETEEAKKDITQCRDMDMKQHQQESDDTLMSKGEGCAFLSTKISFEEETASQRFISHLEPFWQSRRRKAAVIALFAFSIVVWTLLVASQILDFQSPSFFVRWDVDHAGGRWVCDRRGRSNCLPPAEKVTTSITLSDGSERSAVIYVPQSVANATQQSAQLLLLFHGLGDNCWTFIDGDIISLAERDGVVLISACGSIGYLGRGWNAGMCCGFQESDSVNDILFATELIDLTLANVPQVNPQLVAAGGFSNGGMLSEVLACVAPERVRAVISIAGIMEARPGNDGGQQWCDAALQKARTGSSGSPPPGTHMLFIHGDSDWKVPWGGNSFMGFPSVPDNMDRWLLRQGCERGVSESRTTIRNVYFENVLYPQCESTVTSGGPVELELVRGKGLAHRWPSGNSFDASSYMFSFLQRTLRKGEERG